MRKFKECPKCNLISTDEILITVPAMRLMIKDSWICKCHGETATEESGNYAREVLAEHLINNGKR